MKTVCDFFERFAPEENGVETVEYAIILGLIVAGALAAIVAIGIWVNDVFTEASDTIGA